jgi:hypothetical protein
MLRAQVAALMLGPILPHHQSAEPALTEMEVAVRFHVPGPSRRYGILLQAPVAMPCSVVRYRIEGSGPARVSHGLAAGEVVIVRLRGALPEGPALLVVAPVGCEARPGLAHRVILGKASPDHSWRAGLVEAADRARVIGFVAGRT